MAKKIQYDYSNYDADAQGEYNSYIPPEGEYELFIASVAERHHEKLGGDFIELEFAGKGLPQTFTMPFMINMNGDTARIAYETLGKIYCRTRNIKQPPNEWDIDDLQGGYIIAEVKHSPKGDKVYTNLRNIQAVDGQKPAQSAPAPTAQPTTYGKPSWA